MVKDDHHCQKWSRLSKIVNIVKSQIQIRLKSETYNFKFSPYIVYIPMILDDFVHNSYFRKQYFFLHLVGKFGLFQRKYRNLGQNHSQAQRENGAH